MPGDSTKNDGSCLSSLQASLISTWESPSRFPELFTQAVHDFLLTPIRIHLIIFWAFLVLLSLAWCYVAPLLQLHVSSTRKFFHFAIATVYVSGILWDFEFLCVAAVVALNVFFVSEVRKLTIGMVRPEGDNDSKLAHYLLCVSVVDCLIDYRFGSYITD